MSSFYLKARDRNTGEVVHALALDDYFGKHQYGYKMESGAAVGFVLTEEQFSSRYEELTHASND